VRMLDEAIAVERAGTGLIFLGALVQRALVHMDAGDDEAARPLIDQALDQYPRIDHVYANTMTAAAHFADGRLHERRGDAGAARAAFEAGVALAESRDYRLGIGAQWVKCQCGLARVLPPVEAERALGVARSMFATRSRFVWAWILNGTDCVTQYEIASSLAALGREDEAVAELAKAVTMGWANRQQLAHDPAFAELKERPDVRQLLVDASERITLAPPVGTGGMP